MIWQNAIQYGSFYEVRKRPRQVCLEPPVSLISFTPEARIGYSTLHGQLHNLNSQDQYMETDTKEKGLHYTTSKAETFTPASQALAPNLQVPLHVSHVLWNFLWRKE